MNGQELRAVRKKLKLTQRQLAERIGMSMNTVARWERNEVGIKEPIAKLLRLLSKKPHKGGL